MNNSSCNSVGREKTNVLQICVGFWGWQFATLLFVRWLFLFGSFSFQYVW